VQSNVPRRAEDIDVEWMEAALDDHLNGAMIERVETRRLTDPGQTSEAIDIAVTFNDDACPLPKRYIAKLGSNDAEVMALAKMFGLYSREVAFYQTYRDVGIPKPKCFFSFCSEDGTRMVLLLEHLAPARCPSWRPTLAEIELALSHLPAFHGKWWNAPGLKQQACLIPTKDTIFAGSFAAAAAAADQVLAIGGQNSQIAVACVVAVNSKIEKWQAYLDSRDYTIVHADYHGKQMFMPSTEGGKFSIIDWQYPYVAEGPWDFARLLGTCLPYADWVRHGDRLIDAYHDGLIASGVTGYSRDDVLDGIRMGLIFSSMISCIGTASTDTAILAKECNDLGLDWKDVWFARHNQMMIDLDVERFVRSI
jgi:hypothetical protein